MNLYYRLWTLSGDDYTIIQRCNQKTKISFALIGGLVAFLFLSSFASALYAFVMIFESAMLGILLGLFFATMMTNIYLFLLYTFSKTQFPYIPNLSAKLLSYAIRFVVIVFVALMVSKPIESFLFSDKFESELRELKCEKINTTQSTIRSIRNQRIKTLKNSLLHSATMGADDNTISALRNKISQEEKEKSVDLRTAKASIYGSPFFIQGILVMHKSYPSCWKVSIIFSLLFLLPALIKIFLSDKSDYYQQKGKLETGLVEKDYELFLNEYSSIFRNKLELDISYEEHFTDPPFNTKRKNSELPETLTQEDFIENLYNAD